MSCKKTYITTPIYYVNDVAHIGHSYTTVIADAIARYSDLIGYDTFLLTGTDEHGQKIEQSAEKRGKTPKEYADEISKTFQDLWDDFGIRYDHFIRTTDESHKKGVQFAFKKMFDKGDIYKDVYSGNYCVSCETFFTDSQLIDGTACPDCGKETSTLEEESYFFRLSDYQDRLLKHYEDNPNFILPPAKRNEIISFVEGGLKDLSITRTTFDWGVKLPEEMGEEKHIMYVWLDALLNYITALGYGGDNEKMDYWPAKLHLVGKDILRFHSIYWPAFLMSLDLPLPDHIGAHGWWTRDGQKMSKSLGNVVKPREVVDAYGLEAFRYFMLREVPFGGDGDFSEKALISRINGDLGNDLGNLLNRLIGMSGKYFGGTFDSVRVDELFQDELTKIGGIEAKLNDYIYNMQTHRYLEDLWRILTIGNVAIQKNEPWAKIKTDPDEVKALLTFIANLLSKVAISISPVMPETAKKMAESLGIEINRETYQKFIVNGELLNSFTVKKIPALFPKVEEPLMKSDTPVIEEKPKSEPKKKTTVSEDGLITIDKFFETTIKIGTIIEVEEVKKSKKLYRLMVDVGEAEPRQVVAGIREFYKAEELQDSQVCVVANLKPAKLMGLLSEGMLLAAKDESGLSLIRPEHKRDIGTNIS